MIQLKKMLYSKSVILLLLVSTTTSKGFVQDENRTIRDIRNVREHRLSIDRQLENSQNLPIRHADLNRQINQKDKIVERVYDRRSFRTGTIERNSDTRDDRDINNNQRETTRNFSNDRENIRASIRSVRNFVESTRQVNNERENRRIIPDRRQTRDLYDAQNRRDIRIIRVSEDQENRHRQQRLNVRQTTTRRVMKKESTSRSTQIDKDYISRTMFRRELATIQDRDHRLYERRNLDQSQRQASMRNSERRENSRSDRQSTTRFADNREQRTSERRNLDQNQVPKEQISTRFLGNKNHQFESRQSSRRFIQSDARQYSELATRRVNINTREDRLGTSKSDAQTTRSVDQTSGMEKGEERSRDRRGNSLERRVVHQEHRIQNSRQDLRRSTENAGRRIAESRNLGRDRSTGRERTEEFVRNSSERKDQATTRGPSVSMASRERRSVPHDVRIERIRVAERKDRVSDVDSRRHSSRLDNHRRHLARVSELSRSDSTRNIRDGSRVNYPENLPSDRTSTRRISDRRDDLQMQDRYNPLTADSRRYFETVVSKRASRTPERDINTVRLVRNVNYLQFDSWTIWIDALKAALAVFLIGQVLVNSSKTKEYGFSNGVISMMKCIKQKVE